MAYNDKPAVKIVFTAKSTYDPMAITVAVKTIFPAGFAPHCALPPFEPAMKIVSLVEPHIY